jgi:hypothetical protein
VPVVLTRIQQLDKNENGCKNRDYLNEIKLTSNFQFLVMRFWREDSNQSLPRRLDYVFGQVARTCE